MEQNLKPIEYPQWICYECGIKYGNKNIKDDSRRTMITFHENLCSWCDQMKSVCHPRAYGYPQPPIRN